MADPARRRGARSLVRGGGEEVGLVCFRGPPPSPWTGRPSPSGATTPCTSAGLPRRGEDATEVDLAELARRSSTATRFVTCRMRRSRPTRGSTSRRRPSSSRTLNMLLAKNVEAGRLMAASRVGAGQLDQLAASRARRPGRRAVRLLRHAAGGLRHPARVHGQARAGAHRDGARRRRRDHAQGFHPNVPSGHPISFLW